MRQKNTDRARELGVHIARDFYEDFISHPEYLGPNWKWDDFPQFAYRHAHVSCFSVFRHNVGHLQVLKKICADAARKEAKLLLKDGRWDKKA